MENRCFLDEKLQFETLDVKTMYFWSLNTRFYVTMEIRCFLDENVQIETADVKTMIVWSLNTGSYLTMENIIRYFKLEFLIEKPSVFNRRVKTSL